YRSCRDGHAGGCPPRYTHHDASGAENSVHRWAQVGPRLSASHDGALLLIGITSSPAIDARGWGGIDATRTHFGIHWITGGRRACSAGRRLLPVRPLPAVAPVSCRT